MRSLTFALLAVLALHARPARGQDTPDPAEALTNRTYCAALVGDHRLAAGATYGVLFYRLEADKGTPGNPFRLTPEPERLLLPDSVNDLAVGNDLLLVANGPRGLKVVEGLGAGEQPQVVGDLELPGVAMGVAAAGRYAAVAMGVMGVALVDLETPASPSLLGTYDTSGYARQVRFINSDEEGTLSILVANGRGGVATLHVAADSGKLQRGDRTEHEGDVRQVVPVKGGVAVSRGTQGVCLFPDASRKAPFFCFDARDIVRGLAAAEDVIVAGDGGSGLIAIAGLSEWSPEEPIRIDYDQGSLNRVYVMDDVVVLAADYYGVLVFPARALEDLKPAQTVPEQPAESH